MNEHEDEILELGDDFDFDGFQVVRREFFAHTTEPAVSFNNCKFYVNSACPCAPVRKGTGIPSRGAACPKGGGNQNSLPANSSLPKWFP